jgi:hypothetical protein
MAALQPTCDPGVFIEEIRVGYVRYVNIDGRRWEVHGICDKRGHCMVGAVVDGVVLKTLAEAAAAAQAYTGLDCPVTPEFKGCCPLTFVELEPAVR